MDLGVENARAPGCAQEMLQTGLLVSGIFIFCTFFLVLGLAASGAGQVLPCSETLTHQDLRTTQGFPFLPP